MVSEQSKATEKAKGIALSAWKDHRESTVGNIHLQASDPPPISLLASATDSTLSQSIEGSQHPHYTRNLWIHRKGYFRRLMLQDNKSATKRNVSKLDHGDTLQTYHSSASHQSGWSSTLAECVRGKKTLCVYVSSHSISRKMRTSSLVTKFMATPFLPNLPLRPMRWI